MAAGVQEQILTALKSVLEGITTTNGYRTDVATVEWAAKDWNEAPSSAPLPWIGIAPQEDIGAARQGVNEGTWQIDLISHLEYTPYSMEQAVKVSYDLALDIRRALMYEGNAQLGLDDVSHVDLVRQHSNIASTEAYKQGVTTTVYRVVVVYEEALDTA